MIENLIRYLKSERVTFRLLSFPKQEPLPEVAFPKPPVSQTIETYVVHAGTSIGLAIVPAGEQVDEVSLARELGVPCMLATARALPAPFDRAEHVPPFGRLMGAPVFIDARVTSGTLVFRAFSDDDYLEISFDELARVERPRTVAFATHGALPPHTAHPAGRAA